MLIIKQHQHTLYRQNVKTANSLALSSTADTGRAMHWRCTLEVQKFGAFLIPYGSFVWRLKKMMHCKFDANISI